MRQQLVQTLIPKKLEKLNYILDWATEHCSDEQFDRFNEAINEYNEVLLYYPFHGSVNIAHESDYIEIVPDERGMLGSEKEQKKIKEEIKRRKEIVNGLQAEIYELEKLKKDL